ncbi:hypothetical protein ACWGI0_22055 [Streptomyces sp. NPDC054802]
MRLVRGRRGGEVGRDGLPLGEYTADGLQRDVRLLVRTAHEQRVVRSGSAARTRDTMPTKIAEHKTR